MAISQTSLDEAARLSALARRLGCTVELARELDSLRRRCDVYDAVLSEHYHYTAKALKRIMVLEATATGHRVELREIVEDMIQIVQRLQVLENPGPDLVTRIQEVIDATKAADVFMAKDD